MHIVTVDPNETGAVLAAHNFVRRPQFVDYCLGLVHRSRGSALAVASLPRLRNIVMPSSRALNNMGEAGHLFPQRRTRRGVIMRNQGKLSRRQFLATTALGGAAGAGPRPAPPFPIHAQRGPRAV